MRVDELTIIIEISLVAAPCLEGCAVPQLVTDDVDRELVFEFSVLAFLLSAEVLREEDRCVV